MKKTILISLFALLGVAQGAMATEYISDLMLIGSGSSAGKVKQQYVDQGWRDTNYNLNKGCGSSATNIYLLYKTSTNKDDAITDFYIQCGSSDIRPETVNNHQHTYYPVRGEYDGNFIKYNCNLNNNVKGSNRIYLYYTKEPFEYHDAITSIWFDNAPIGAVGSNGDYNSPCDLNSGGGGEFIYLHVTYGVPPTSYDYEDHEWDATNRKVITTTKTCTGFTRLGSDNNYHNTVLKDGWYVVDHSIEYQEYLDIDGDVKIILVNGATMLAKNGIRIKTDKKLTIYGQSGNSGKIQADGSIGGKGDIYAGELIIHGGIIDCKSKSHNNAAIGSGHGSNNSKAGFKAITIYGGKVTATGTEGGAGIGSGDDCDDDYQGPITIYGGDVDAMGGTYGAGIGGGRGSGNGPIYIYGGTVVTEGGENAPGIGCGICSHLCNDIYILGGIVYATGGNMGADGIGSEVESSWFTNPGTNPKQDKDLYIENATVSATGSGEDLDKGLGINVRNLSIKNSHVTITSNGSKVAQVKGDVILSDNMRVGYKNKDQRVQTIKEDDEKVVVYVCDQHYSWTDNGDGTHHSVCNYCYGVNKPHSYTKRNGVYTCICGDSKDFVSQAIWCAGNNTLYFIHPDTPYKAGEKYNGQQVTSVWSGGYVLSTGNTAPGWSAVKAEAQKVVFDESFAEAKPTSLVSWFSDFTSLTTADLNGLDVSEVQNATSMFSGCTSLTTLYCDNIWSIADTEGMFTGCTSLKGAVSYNSGSDNGTMANPASGYFMKKWTVKLFNDNNIVTVSNLSPYTNETVTISGKGDSNSGLTAVSVTGRRTDADITVTDNGNGTWSFTMPAEDVTVNEEINIAIFDNVDNSDMLKQYKGMMVNITYDRILSAMQNANGTWTSKAYTTCLPYEVDLREEFNNDQVRLYELIFVNDDYEFVFNGVVPATIMAGKPYLVVVDSASINLSARNVVTLSYPEEEEGYGVVYPNLESWKNMENGVGWWRGTYRLIDNEECTQMKAFLLDSDGTWKGANNDTEAHRKVYVPTYRAYFLPKVFTDYRVYDTKFTVVGGGGDPTDSWFRLPDSYDGDFISSDETGIQPTIHTIDADGTNTYYDLQGRKLGDKKPTRKGGYIKTTAEGNGKIVLIK